MAADSPRNPPRGVGHPERHPRDDLEEDAAEGPHVEAPWLQTRPEILLAALGAHPRGDDLEGLRRHVLRCCHPQSFRIVETESRSEVDEPSSEVLPIFSDEDVVWLQVAMHDTVASEKVERQKNLP